MSRRPVAQHAVSPVVIPEDAVVQQAAPRARRPLAAARLAAVSFAAACVAALALAGCAVTPPEPPEGPPSRHFLRVVTADNHLIRINAGQPARVLERRALSGLEPGETVVGIDYRVARGVLYALTSGGRLCVVDIATGALRPVGSARVALSGRAFGVDFSPTVDRVRVVSDTGQNLRIHPDTGAQVDADPAQPGLQTDGALGYVPGDAHAGATPRVLAAAYTYNKRDDKLTTNYAIDAATGALITQGTQEDVKPAVHPNTGRLYTVGMLGVGALSDVSMDIADVDNAALAVLATPSDPRAALYTIDLRTGRASRVGLVGGGAAVRGIAIEP